jgi:hypothetical protein
MATQYLKFKGPCKWAQVYKQDDKYNNYKIQLYLNAETKAAYIKSGIQVGIKTDEDGEYVVFRRPHAKLIKGDVANLGPPKVEDKDRNPFTQTIGNGSIVEVDVSVYDTIKGKGHTLNAVKVIDHVEYVRQAD